MPRLPSPRRAPPAARAEELLAAIFEFHPLAIDDALQEAHVPKIDDWDEYVYLVLYGVDFDQAKLEVDSHEVDVFLGANYLVTHHTEQINAIERLRSIARDHEDRRLAAILDTSEGTIQVDLMPEEAPGNVANFVNLARQGFYNNLTWHRCIPNFVIQGGCPKGDGSGGPGYTIKCETEKNTHKHVAGTLSMAHAGKNTGGSQFFICHGPQPHLDGKHTVFGKVDADGMKVVYQIRQGDVVNSIRVTDA